MRPAVEEMKRRALTNPSMGFAFRRLLDADVSPEDLLKLANDKTRKTKK